MAKHPHQVTIAIRPGFYLDPHPAHGHRNPFQTQAAAERELQSAIGNQATMTALRALLPVSVGHSNMSDPDVIVQVAILVGHNRAQLKFSRTDPGELPWPDILRDLARFEGTVRHMYRDSLGFVTVGVGTMLASVHEAQAMGFNVRSTGKVATPEEVAREYASVNKQAKALPAESYITALDLPQSGIDAALKKRAEKSAAELAARYKGWDKYPVEVKRALIDMRYNMNENLNKFVNFQGAIEKAAQTKVGKDWEAAANESERYQVGDERNEWTEDMILKGGGVKK